MAHARRELEARARRSGATSAQRAVRESRIDSFKTEEKNRCAGGAGERGRTYDLDDDCDDEPTSAPTRCPSTG